MNDWFLNKLKRIVKSEDSLSGFIRMNDVKQIYDFCKESETIENEMLYTEEEFSEKVEEIIDTIPSYIFDDNEW